MPPTVHDPGPSARLTHERTGGSGPGIAFIAGMVALALIAGALLVVLAVAYPAVTNAESAYAQADTPAAKATAALGSGAARNLVAAAGVLAVVGAGLLGRRLFHNDGVGLLAATLLVLDPAFLALGHLALPVIPVLALAVAGAGLLATARGTLRWLGSLLLAGASFVEPVLAAWAVPLLLLVLLRGNIYAAPKHLGSALAQVALLPVLAAGAGQALGSGGTLACLAATRPDHLLLAAAPDTGSVIIVHNPAFWFGGLAALLVLGGAAVVHVLRHFRLARLPGRIQLRLPDPLPAYHARALWLLLLAVCAPLPSLWMPLLAIALAAAIHHLARDAPGFGLAVALGSVAFAVLYLVRFWSLVTGNATGAEVADLLPVVPWAQMVACGG